MQVIVVYDSVSEPARRVAEAIGASLRRSAGSSVGVLPTGAVSSADLQEADLVVVGGPTHLGSSPAVGARLAGRATARRDGRSDAPEDVAIDLVDASDLPTVGPGLRRWFHDLGRSHGGVAAAFDTHRSGDRGASGVIARRLGRHGYRVVGAEGFVVDGATGSLSEDELVRATRWASDLAHQVASAVPR